MSATSRDLTTGSVPAHLARLSIPMIWGILAIVSLQLTDVYFISRLGHTQLEAVSFTFPISMLIFNLVMGLSIATSSISARLIGAGETETLKHFLAHALMIATATGIILAVIGEIVMIPVFRTLGAGPEHMQHIISFMRISLWGYLFLTVPLVGNAAIRAAGDTITPSLIMVGIALINVPLSYALIFGHFGAPGLGVAGAALSNVISNAISALAAFAVLIFRVRLLNASCLTFTGFKASARRLLMIAVPIGLTNLVQPLVIAILTAILSLSGGAAVAAYGIITRIEAMAAVVLMALSIGMSPLIGQNFGAGKLARVQETIRTTIIFAIFWSFSVGVMLMATGGLFARQFTTDATTIHMTTTYFILIGVSTTIANLAVGWGSAWNALGQPRYSVMLIVIRSTFGMLIPAYLGHLIAGWYGLFVGLMLGNLIIGFALHLWSAKIFQKRMMRGI